MSAINKILTDAKTDIKERLAKDRNELAFLLSQQEKLIGSIARGEQALAEINAYLPSGVVSVAGRFTWVDGIAKTGGV